MAQKLEALDRLKSQLLTTGLQQKDFPLYQVINQLIGYLRDSIDNVNEQLDDITGGGSGGMTQSFITTENEKSSLPSSRILVAGSGISTMDDGTRLVINSAVPLALDGEDGEPGIQGPRGFQGEQGLRGLSVPSLYDGYEPDIEIPIPIADLMHFPPPGVWIDVPFNASDFTSDVGSWTVDSADVTHYSYMLIQNTMFVLYHISDTSVSGTPNSLAIKIPAGFASAYYNIQVCFAIDNGTREQVRPILSQGSTTIGIAKFASGATWANSANNTGVFGMVIVPIAR